MTSPSDADGEGFVAAALQTAGIDANGVIERMKKAARFKKDSELAQFLRTAQPNISKWRKRNHIPYGEALFVSIKTNTPISSILHDDDRSNRAYYQSSPLNKILIRSILGHMHAHGSFIIPDNLEVADKIDQMSRTITFLYARLDTMMVRLITEDGLDPESAARAAARAGELFYSDGALFDAVDKRE